MRTTLTPLTPATDPRAETRAFGAVALSLAIVVLVGFAAMGGLAPFALHRLGDARQARLRPVARASIVAAVTPTAQVGGSEEPIEAPSGILLAAAPPAAAAPAVTAETAAPVTEQPAAAVPPASAPAPAPAPAAPVAPADQTPAAPAPAPAVEPEAPKPPAVTPSAIVPASNNGGGTDSSDEKPGNGPKDKTGDSPPKQEKSDPPGKALGHDKTTVSAAPAASSDDGSDKSGKKK